MPESASVTPEFVIENLIELRLRTDIKIDELLESGKLVRRGSGWYEVLDKATMNAVSPLATAVAAGDPPRVRLSKTANNKAKKLLERTRTDMLRDAAESFERSGKTELVAECRKLLREREAS